MTLEAFSQSEALTLGVELELQLVNTVDYDLAHYANDMLRLMAALREAEGGQRVVRAYDEMLGTVLQRIGEIS